MFTYLLYLLILQLEFFHWKQISVDFKSQHLHDNPLFMLRGGIENLTNVPLTDDNKICLTSILTSLPIPKPQTFIETDGHRLINNTIKITDGYPTVSPSTKAVNWFLYPVSRFRTIASIESHLSLSLSLSLTFNVFTHRSLVCLFYVVARILSHVFIQIGQFQMREHANDLTSRSEDESFKFSFANLRAYFGRIISWIGDTNGDEWWKLEIAPVANGRAAVEKLLNVCHVTGGLQLPCIFFPRIFRDSEASRCVLDEKRAIPCLVSSATSFPRPAGLHRYSPIGRSQSSSNGISSSRPFARWTSFGREYSTTYRFCTSHLSLLRVWNSVTSRDLYYQ